QQHRLSRGASVRDPPPHGPAHGAATPFPLLPSLQQGADTGAGGAASFPRRAARSLGANLGTHRRSHRTARHRPTGPVVVPKAPRFRRHSTRRTGIPSSARELPPGPDRDTSPPAGLLADELSPETPRARPGRSLTPCL